MTPHEWLLQHRASTQQGSSGSPLLQLPPNQNELGAIAMHIGVWDFQHGLNYASSTATIEDFLSEIHLHGTLPRFPAHPPADALESYRGFKFYLSISKLYCFNC